MHISLTSVQKRIELEFKSSEKESETGLTGRINRIKIVIGGDGGIGKTTLLKVFCGEGFSDQDMTIALDIFTKHLYITDETHEILQIWDLGGQEHFRFLLSDLLKGAQGVILAFDMSRRNSFLNLKEWISLIKANSPQAPILLMGTKADLGYHPTLSLELAREFVRSNNLIDYIEVSTKNNLNIEIPFIRLIESIKQINQGTVEIKFNGAQPPKSSHKVKTESKIAQNPTEHPIYSKCPHCNNPLRDTQIKLQESGRRVLCQNCFKMI